VNENRSVIQAQLHKDGKFNVDKELSVKWQEMGFEGQNPYHLRFESGDLGPAPSSVKQAQDTRDEDVEMGEDGEDEEEG
jgi:hypothetical protein